LLREDAEQVVKLEAGDGENWLVIELRIVEAVEQMNASRTRRGEAYWTPRSSKLFVARACSAAPSAPALAADITLAQSAPEIE
jgi:hypothetical protein